jgi:hypothetical protein
MAVEEWSPQRTPIRREEGVDRQPTKRWYTVRLFGRTDLRREQCGVKPRGRSIERPLPIKGYAYLAVSFPRQRQGRRQI